MTIKPRPGAQRVSPALGAANDPRARRSGTNEVEFPLVYEGGKLKLVISGISPLAVDPQRGLYERVADGLEVSSASPYATRVALGDGLELNAGRIVPRFSKTVQINTKKQIVAVVSTEDVSDATDGTAASALGRIGNELAAIDVRIDALEIAPPAHTHGAADVSSGTLDIARIPTGATGTTVPFGNDSRFTDARTPTAHTTSHKDGGSDEIATTTAASGAIPKAGTNTKLAQAWIPESSYHDFAKAGATEYEAWFAANCATHTAFSAQALVANRMYALPFVAPGRTGCTLDRLGINVTTGSAGNARLGIYNDSGGYPGTLLLDAGTVSTTGIAVVTATISQALVPGNRYWYAYVSDATPTVRSIPVNCCSHALGFSSALGTAGNCGLYVAYAYAALPTPFPSTPTMITANPIPALFYRFSA